MAAKSITISGQDAAKIADILRGLAFLLTAHDLGPAVAIQLSEGPYGDTMGLEPTRHFSTLGSEPIAKSIRELAGLLAEASSW